MKFKVMITETLKLSVDVEAKDQHEAEQIVSDNWRKSEYVLDADNFVGVEFEAISVDKQDVKYIAGVPLEKGWFSMDNRELLEAIENYLFTEGRDTIPHPTGFEEDLLDDVAGTLVDRIDFFGRTGKAYAEESDEQHDFCQDVWNALRYAVCVGAAVERGDLTLK